MYSKHYTVMFVRSQDTNIFFDLTSLDTQTPGTDLFFAAFGYGVFNQQRVVVCHVV